MSDELEGTRRCGRGLVEVPFCILSGESKENHEYLQSV
jgi:hypothetical protein